MPVRNPPNVVGADMDDLRRKVNALEAEAARLRDLLAASEARHALILESATDYAIITTDLAGRITGWNVGARNVLGWQDADALGQPAHLFFTPEDRAAGVPEKEMERASTQGRASDERWHLRRDGSRFWASGLMMPLKHEGGRPQGYLKIVRDRTDQRRTEEALRATTAEKDLLIAEVHHRVRNNLQLVQNLLTLQARGRGYGDCGAARGECSAGANHCRHPRATLPQRCAAGREGRPLPLQLRISVVSESMGNHDSGDHGCRVPQSRRRWSSGRRHCGM